jgi:L-rhamnose isomerase
VEINTEVTKPLSYREKYGMVLISCAIFATIFYFVGVQDWGMVLLFSGMVGDVGIISLLIVLGDLRKYG